MSKKEVQNYFKDQAKKPTIETYDYKRRVVNYAYIGNESLPSVVFLHGAPGSWSAFINFMKDTTLLSHSQLISVDRPGYGHSNFGSSVPSLSEQSDMLVPLLQKFKGDGPLLLVGHSLGGPLAVRMAIDHPDLIDGIILVAPSIAPELEPDENWFRMPLHTPFLRWILPASFRVTNDEIYFLKEQLEEMLPEWEKLKLPITVIQGEKDGLVHPGNADFAKKMAVNAPVELIVVSDMNHFVPWTHPGLIKQAIIKQLDLLAKSLAPTQE